MKCFTRAPPGPCSARAGASEARGVFPAPSVADPRRDGLQSPARDPPIPAMVDAEDPTVHAGAAAPGRWRRRLLLALLATGSGLFAAEVGLRLLAWLRADGALAAWQQQTAAGIDLVHGQAVRLGQIVRPSPHADIVYELLPDLNVSFRGQPVVTCASGFRDAEPRRDLPDAGYCIVGIGDSVMFGSGVAGEATFLAVLRQKVQQQNPRIGVQTVNTAVPGYNTAMEVATLARKGLALRPDLVIVDFVENDFDLPNFLLLPENWGSPRRSFLFDLAKSALRPGRNPNGPLAPAPMADKLHFESDPERVPAAYRDMVGLGGYRRAMTALRDLAHQHGFRVLVSCHVEIDPAARAVCDELGFPVVTGAAKLRAWLQAHGGIELYDSPLVQSRDDVHPTALAHGMLADALFEFLVANEWLPE
jgi:lysophospholipase L1-like esterase